jgi:hypothetical protein
MQITVKDYDELPLEYRKRVKFEVVGYFADCPWVEKIDTTHEIFNDTQ